MPPAARLSDVRRDDLVRLLMDAPAPLVSVLAPSGYGKTTLLGQYSAARAGPSAWVTLGEDCNDPVTLARYLAAALESIGPVPDDLTRALDAPRPKDREVTAALAAWIRDSAQVSIVLDDAHLLEDPRATSLVSSIVGELPADARAVFGARHETSFPLAAARARAEVFEVGIDRLRFSVEEAEALLRSAGVASIAPDEVSAITERTEGWAVALYLAGRAFASGSATPTMFGGDDRYVTDYVRETMLTELPDEEVDFLIRSSLLDELSGALCDAALERSGSGAMLEGLEASNLLVVPLDHRRGRYRYHHLFRDLLRMELDHRSPELVGPITARASAWCESEGEIDLAVSYAMAGHHVGRVADLIGRYGQATYYGGRVGSVRAWFDWFASNAPRERDPLVAVLGAWLMVLDGRPVEAERWLQGAIDGPRPDALDPEVEGIRTLAIAMMCRDGVAQMLADAEQGAAAIGPASPWRTPASLLIGLAHGASGDRTAAMQCFERAAEIADEVGAAAGGSLAHAELAILSMEANDLVATAAHVSDARRTIDESNLHAYPTSVPAYAAAARLHVLQGDPVRAREWLDHATSVDPDLTYAFPTLALQTKVVLARCAVGLGDGALAESLLADADEIVRHRPDLGTLVDELESIRGEYASLRRSATGVPALSPAEARLLPLLATHRSFREIGELLFISPHTVKTQAISIYRKLGVTSRGAAVETSRRIGLLPT